jgi:ubiquinone/menaquinone biosynthesis C-methylase UbiE
MEKSRFEVIANAYESALAKYPFCRRDHYWLLQKANMQPDSCVLEISGGTGFLTEKIVQIVTSGKIIVQDVAESVLSINALKCRNTPNIEYMVEDNMHFPHIADSQFDVIIGLGGFHHIEDQVTFSKTLYRIVKNDGIVCLGDFEDNSSMQRYFDEKVHHITPTGHQGIFASESRFINLARFAGFDHVKVERKKIAFCFREEYEIGEFFQMVHSLDQSPEETLNDIKKYFDLIEHNDGVIVVLDYVYSWYKK